MTRDKERIDEVLDELETYWKDHHDMRLGQILSNISQRENSSNDPFYMEDDTLLSALEKMNKDGKDS